MTIRIPNPNLADMFLKFLGKKRAVHLPANLGKLWSILPGNRDKRELLESAIRPKSKKLPEGSVDIFLVKNLRD